MALTSRTHQSYTRKWARECGVPVFSIDYKKAPEFPYPYALDDSWQTYNWLLHESHKHFRIRKNKRIILAGDSAGGNLIMGVTNLCLMTGTRLPIAIVPFYPCVSFSVKRFTPSYMHIINNPMIPYEFLLFCAEAYIQREEFDNETDFLLQPIYTPAGLLRRFPPIRMYQGEADPLHDSSVKFALRAAEAGADIQLTLYQKMVHGFLSLDIVAGAGLKYAWKCVEESIRVLRELIDSEL